jgi:hypothetical protein
MNKYKFPRIYHIDFSEGSTSDDKFLQSYDHFIGKQVCVSIKMDGENTTIYDDGSCHARSIDSKDHPSRNWMKRFAGNIGLSLPKKWRICGENLYAKHSIFYEELDSYFYAFSIWNESNEILSLEETLEYCALLEIYHVPILAVMEFDYGYIKQLYEYVVKSGQEGIVVRVCDSFKYEDMSENIFKAVRKNHVQTSDHWMNQALVQNKLKVRFQNLSARSSADV